RRPGASFGAARTSATWNSTTGVEGARVLPDGTVLDNGGIIISGYDGYSYPASAFDGTNFVVTWEDEHLDGSTFRIYAKRVTPGGSVLDQERIPVTPPPQPQARDPRIASSAESSLIASGLADVTAARVSHDGIVLDPDSFAVSAELNQQSDAALA